MGVWTAMALIAVAVMWALTGLGRRKEQPRRGHWRVTGIVISAAMILGGVLAAARGGWALGAVLAAGGVWLAVRSRERQAGGWSTRRRADEGAQPSAPPETGMSVRDARAILGVGDDASPAEINAAWKRLMARAHPDQGGTQGLAAQLNAARDRLLKR